MKVHLILLFGLAAISLAAQELITNTKSQPEIEAARLIEGVNDGLQDRVRRFQRLWEALWENPRATPEDILAALGPNAVRVFQAAGAARADLEAIAEIAGTTAEVLLGDPKYLSPAQPVVFHEDGTVTLAPP